MPFTPVLLADDTQRYAQEVAQLTQRMAPLQECLDAYTALGLATAPTTTDLADLWNAPTTFLERMLTGGQPVTLGGGGGGLVVAPGQVYQLLAKPAGTEAFLATIKRLHGQGASAWNGGNVSTEVYELVGGTLQIKQAQLDSIRETCRIYARSQRQKDEWDALQVVVNTLETIRQNGRFGAAFDAPQYLKEALTNGGNGNALNPIQANAAYIASGVL
ncbi:hypothetical protein GCM10023172_27500 [Hymenobacter ginsengisoli]|uniref:Phage tail protein n=1 Tax=Hymenobacter ginsengisoli TaxID=1051626 RepID=A0ABP8QJX9_9BACT|nr:MULTISPECIES: hypothetical protein [unclassified Hymenobacter]MBO2029995.1 hypothetical protein [Hymenobacter sp. BT559]